jgi:hypothetical protein
MAGRRFRSLAGVVTAVLIAMALGTAVGSAKPADPAPAAVVRAYLAALAAHRPAAVCATFSAPLRQFEAVWEPVNSGPDTCARRIEQAHFSPSYPGADIHTIKLLKLTTAGPDPYGDVAVHVLLWFKFQCLGSISYIPGCRPHFERRSDVIYLREFHDRWLLVKPGQIYGWTSGNAGPEDQTSPPGDATSVSQLAALPPAPSCPAPTLSVSSHSDTLTPVIEFPGAKDLPSSAGPWLDVTNLAAGWLGRRQICVTATLAAPPRNDTSYSLQLSQSDGESTAVGEYGFEVDATGALEPQLTDAKSDYGSSAACPTAFGLSDDKLVMIFSPSDWLNPAKPVAIDVYAASQQINEPLLSDPLNASFVAGGTLTHAASGIPRCRTL